VAHLQAVAMWSCPSPSACCRFLCLVGVFISQINSDSVGNTLLLITESQNHRMIRVGRDLKDRLVPTPLS